MPVPKRLLGTAEYYKFRALDFKRRNPDKDPPDSYLNFGDKYARKFTGETFGKLSDQGKAWDLSARRKLQDKMEGILHDPQNAGIEHRPEELKDKAYDAHSDAYVQAGIGDLDWGDLLDIWSTVDPEDWDYGEMLEVAPAVVRGQWRKLTD